MPNERELPRTAITSSCLGDDRLPVRPSSTVYSTASPAQSGISNSATTPLGSSPVSTRPGSGRFTTSRGESFQSDSLTDYMIAQENEEEMEEEMIRLCTGSTPTQACGDSIDRINRYNRSTRFSREDIRLHERDLAAMARNNQDERNALKHEWFADRIRIDSTSPGPVTNQNMTDPGRALVRQWFERCTVTPVQICNCQSVLPALIQFLPEELIPRARALASTPCGSPPSAPAPRR